MSEPTNQNTGSQGNQGQQGNVAGANYGVQNTYYNSGGRQLSKQEYRNRRNLLTQMRTEVESRLTQSIHRAAFVNLGKEQQPQQVQRPWDMSVKVGEQRSVQLPPQTTILDVFDNPTISGKFLILGKPGGGKTTTLLELAEALIERAEGDSDAPIPVILELSSWQEVTKPKFLPFGEREKYDPSIKEWVLSQLMGKGVSQEIGEQWLRDKELVLLLDGLDELQPERQAKCVRAINQFFSSEFSPSHLVVCSRKEEYEDYEEILRLNGAICLEDLTNEQIRDYFTSVNLGEFWESIKGSEKIVNFIRQPLFLAITSIAYQQIDVEEWRNCNSEKNSIDYLLGIYRVKMITSKLKSQWYKLDQNSKQSVFQNRIIRLAKYLSEEPTSMIDIDFSINIFNSSIYGFIYFVLTYSSYFLICVYTAKQSILLSYDYLHDTSQIIIVDYLGFVFFSLAICIVSGILASILGVICLEDRNKLPIIKNITPEIVQKSIYWIFYIFGALGFLVFMFIAGITLSAMLGYPDLSAYKAWKTSFSTSTKAIIVGLGITTFFSLSHYSFNDTKTKPIIIYNISFNYVAALFIYGLSVFIAIWVMLGLFTEHGFLIFQFLYANRDIFLFVIITVVNLGIAFGFIANPNEAKKINEDTAIINSFITFTIVCLLGMISGIIPSLKFGINIAISNSMILGLIFGSLTGFSYIQYFAFRLTLWLTGIMPWNITRFLDYCTERLILQRVGNRYRFIHRLVQEHFAKLEIQKE